MITITKESNIGEVLKADMNIAPILMKSGLHCLGCPSSQRETLEQAGMVHGIDVDVLVNEINEYLISKN